MDAARTRPPGALDNARADLIARIYDGSRPVVVPACLIPRRTIGHRPEMRRPPGDRPRFYVLVPAPGMTTGPKTLIYPEGSPEYRRFAPR